MNEASYDRVNIMKAIQVVILTPRDMNVKANKQTDPSSEGGNEGEEQED